MIDMNLKKEVKTDKIEILSTGVVQVRRKTEVIDQDDNNSVISSSFHRYTVSPDDDTTDLPEEVKQVCELVKQSEGYMDNWNFIKQREQELLNGSN